MPVRTRVALTYPGQGAYSPGLLRQLQQTYPQLTEHRSRLRAAWLAETGEDLDVVEIDAQRESDLSSGSAFGSSQLLIFAASSMMHSILAPHVDDDVVHLGHSFGEIAALTAAGAWSIEDGARVVAARVRALQSVRSEGGMVALSAASSRVEALVQAVGGDDIGVAVHNGPGQVVVAGALAPLERLERAAAAVGISTARLRSPYAFHSPAMRPAVLAFEQAIRVIGWTAPRQAVYSPILGRYYRADDDLAALVASHLSEPFDFGVALTAVHAAGCELFIECGGRSALSSAVRRTLSADGADDTATWRAVPADDGVGQPMTEALRAVAGAPSGTGHTIAARTVDRPDTADMIATLRELLRADLETITRQLVAEYTGHSTGAPAAPPPAAPQPAELSPATTSVATAERRAGTATAPVAAKPDRATVLDALVQLYAEALEYPPEVFDESVELEGDLGVDSVKQTELLARAADRFDLPVQPSDFVIGEFPTLGHIADLVLRSA